MTLFEWDEFRLCAINNGDTIVAVPVTSFDFYYC
jgi:hypothetical protein